MCELTQIDQRARELRPRSVQIALGLRVGIQSPAEKRQLNRERHEPLLSPMMEIAL